jgi:hypothetical protein
MVTDTKVGATEVELQDIYGRSFFRQPIDASLLIDLSASIAPGVYVAHFYLNGQVVERKRWVKE